MFISYHGNLGGLLLYELEVSIREKKAVPNDTHHR
jgi:hypothetical protein